MYTVIRKHALKNAYVHGKADLKAVMPKVIGELPDAKKDIKGLVAKINEVLNEVNKLSKEKILAELQSLAPELLEAKVEEKGLKELPGDTGRVLMRFAPFPSGALHIGSSRAMILNDEYVKKYKGELILFIDDTIGSEAKQIMGDAYTLIPEGMKWLGCDYTKIYHKSDRLEAYYDYARKMIKKGLAYVCECEGELMSDYRAQGIECQHRKQSAKENLEKFEKMFNKYKQGEAVLRIKTDMKYKNPAFRDRVIMRISEMAHPRVGNKYRVWPLMDFSWAVDDLWMGITHIYRGKDLYIEDLMENYIWEKMGEDYHPVMLHWGLLSIEGVKMSKSKAQAEVKSGGYTGWDDPRTWSMQSLGRRGIKPEAVREFVLEMGTSENDIKVPIDKLYTINRRMIDATSLRYFFTKNPVKLVVSDCPLKKALIPLHHTIKKSRSYIIEQGVNEYYISGDDVALLKKEKTVRLKDLMNIELVSAGKTIKAKYAKNQDEVYNIKKIQFVTNASIECEVLKEDGTVDKGLAEDYTKSVKTGEIIQFERYGFVRKEKENEYIYTHP